MGDAKAAAIAGVRQEEWDKYAAFVQAHVRDDTRAYWYALLQMNGEDRLPSPESLVIFAHRRWGVISADVLAQQYALAVPVIEGGFRELNQLGLAEWPAPLAVALEAASMDDLRAVFGPRGIKGQSRAVIVTRALEALGEREVRSVAEAMAIDLNQPALTERGLALRMSFDAPDPRCERLQLMAQQAEAHPLPGLPEDFGRRERYLNWTDDAGFDEDDDPSVPPEGDAADLRAMMHEVIELTGQLLEQPTPSAEVVASVHAGTITLVDMLGKLSLRLMGDRSSDR